MNSYLIFPDLRFKKKLSCIQIRDNGSFKGMYKHYIK